MLIRATAFWSRLENPIVEVTLGEAGSTGRVIPPCGFVSANGTCRQRSNLGASRSYGLETEIEARPADRWTLSLTHSWNPTEVIEAPGNEQLIGKSILGQADHTLTGRLRWVDPRIADVSITGRYVSRRFDDDLNTLDLDAFFTTDLRAARSVTANLELFGTVENVLDTEYTVNRARDGSYRIAGPRRFEAGVRGRW
jgi:outer membrane receptor protein involved in Fe transport